MIQQKLCWWGGGMTTARRGCKLGKLTQGHPGVTFFPVTVISLSLFLFSTANALLQKASYLLWKTHVILMTRGITILQHPSDSSRASPFCHRAFLPGLTVTPQLSLLRTPKETLATREYFFCVLFTCLSQCSAPSAARCLGDAHTALR